MSGMSSAIVTIQEANFVDRMINGKYRVKMPAFLAAHDSFDNWERERFDSMEKNLKPGDVLFDVGAETGHISAVYARFVGAQNMVLFEPNPDNWQNIKATWDLEELPTPLATRCALVSDKTHVPDTNYGLDQLDGWPALAWTGRIWTPRSYRYIHEHAHNTAQIALDDFVKDTEIVPKAITVDVEGAEIKVLRGARGVLATIRPLVWVSIHPDLMLEHYKTSVDQLHAFMFECGYDGEYLATDHEVHMLYRPRP